MKTGDVDRTFTTVACSLADLHMILLEPGLDATNKLLRARVRRDAAQEALHHDASHPMATAELARLDGAQVLPALRAVAAARPTDGRAWYLLAREEKDPTQREAALRRAVEHWPDGALAQAMLALHLASTDRAREALPFANRAVELAPWSPEVIAALARVALELGKCPEALLLQERAAEVAQSHGLGSAGSDAKELRVQLATYRGRCEQRP